MEYTKIKEIEYMRIMRKIPLPKNKLEKGYSLLKNY